MTQTDKMFHENKKKEDSPTLKIVWMYQYKDSMNILKRAKKDLLKQPITSLATEVQTKTKTKIGNRNAKKKTTTVFIFQATNLQDCSRADLDMASKGKNFKREIESLQIAAPNNAIRTNYIKMKIHNTQQNNNCRLCGERDETVTHVRE